jgi:outer membrane protein assembly factor BamB
MTCFPGPEDKPLDRVKFLMLMLAAAVTTSAAPRNDWPVYRHDAALSGVSPGKGRIVTPRVLAEYYLGAPFVGVAADGQPVPDNVADLDGDGTQERFALTGRTIEVTDLSGKRLSTFAVDGHPLGGNVRVSKLFPDRKGQQIVSFSHRMDTGEGQGYCFSFDKGVEHGELAWTTGPLAAQYAPTLIIDDLDGDGLPDIALAPHYRVQIFNGQTGALKAEVPVAKGRNYGILLSRPRRDRPQKDIFVISDFVLHAECVRFEGGKWVHAWGQKYLENENAAVPEGRQKYLRVGPNPVADLDGDGQDELAYMLVDASRDDQWRLVVHDCETGKVKADIGGVWLWSIGNLDGDGVAELVYTPTPQKRPATYTDLHVGRLRGGALEDLAVLRGVRPLLMNATLPPTRHTIADEGLLDLLRANLGQDGRPSLFHALRAKGARFEDTIRAASLLPSGRLDTTWSFTRPGHRLNLVSASGDQVHVRDLTESKLFTLNRRAEVIHEAELGKPGGFATLPIVVDLDGDGRNEIVLQTAVGEIVALEAATGPGKPPSVLWSVPGVAMNQSPGYAWNGALCPQAADVDGDGRPEVFFAAEDEHGLSSLVCADGRGRTKWRRSIEGCPWGGLQAGVDHWTFGRFTGRQRGWDVYVDLHRRSKGSGEGWLLRGHDGSVVWRQKGLVAAETAMPFGGGIPAVADLNRDGIDDLAQMFFTVYGAIAGNTGQPLFPAAFLSGPSYFGKWTAYSEPTIADLDGDGAPDVYLNSRSYARGAYAAIHADGKSLWAEFHNNDEGSDGLGPVGDFDGDGRLEVAIPVLNGTLLCVNGSNGAHRWTVKTPVTGDVVAADIDGDGIMELLFAGRDGRLRALSGKDGHEVWSIGVPGQPVVADVNGDGQLEVLAVGGDGVLRIVGDAGEAGSALH